MSKETTRKEVQLDTETIKALTLQAIDKGKTLKAYLEDVLINQGKNTKK